MIHVTHAQADKLARLVEEAAIELRSAAARATRDRDAMVFIGDERLAEFHRSRRGQLLGTAHELEDVAARLRARETLPGPTRARRLTRRAG